MYIYDRNHSGARSLFKEQPISSQPALRNSYYPDRGIDGLEGRRASSGSYECANGGLGQGPQPSKASGPEAEVRAFRESLNKWRVAIGQTPITESGPLGPVTRTAVLEFQQDTGLKRDGIIGPDTWKRLTLLLDILKNIPDSPEFTMERRRLRDFVGSRGFGGLEEPTQSEVLMRIIRYGKAGTLDNIRHLTNLVTHLGFELLPASSRKLMLRALAARPDDVQLASDLSLLIDRPSFRNLVGPTQTWVLKRIEGYAGNRRKIDNLVNLITFIDFFDGLSNDSQKVMLIAHAKHPENKQLVDDFTRLALRTDFTPLDQPTQTEVLTRIQSNPSGPGNVENLMNLVTTPGFGNLGLEVRAQILDGLFLRFDHVQLDPPKIANMMSLVTALGFEKLRPDVRSIMLDLQAARANNTQLATALGQLAESARFRHDHRNARQTVLQVDSSIP